MDYQSLLANKESDPFNHRMSNRKSAKLRNWEEETSHSVAGACVWTHTHTHTHTHRKHYSSIRGRVDCTWPVIFALFPCPVFPHVPRDKAGSGQCHWPFNTCRSSDRTYVHTCLPRVRISSPFSASSRHSFSSLLFSSLVSLTAFRERVEEGNDVLCMASRRWSNRWKQPSVGVKVEERRDSLSW